MYTITKLFIDGNLEGLTYTETTSVKFEVGKEYGGSQWGSRYRIVSCVGGR